MLKKILIATHNPSKFAQMKQILEPLNTQLVSLADCGITVDVEESGTTLEENARIKAHFYATLSGLPALADDSGLEVDALGGKPGVHSSRWAGTDKTDLEKVNFLLEKMNPIPDMQRTARFSCSVVLAYPDGTEKKWYGTTEGLITCDKRGTLKKGFPYCTVFLLPEYGKTMAELADEGILYRAHRLITLEKVIADLKNR